MATDLPGNGSGGGGGGAQQHAKTNSALGSRATEYDIQATTDYVNKMFEEIQEQLGVGKTAMEALRLEAREMALDKGSEIGKCVAALVDALKAARGSKGEEETKRKATEKEKEFIWEVLSVVQEMAEE
jgi:hypothetical protein